MKKLNDKTKALFLDRDGTINIDKGYISKIEDFEFQRGIFNLIKTYTKQDFLVIIITNQSGIARGFYSEKDFNILSDWMVKQFEKEGITITQIYHCPHHPDYTGECNCRKPNPGMIVKAITKYNIDPVKSVLIGDKKRDILAGENAGIGKNLYIQDLLGDKHFSE